MLAAGCPCGTSPQAASHQVGGGFGRSLCQPWRRVQRCMSQGCVCRRRLVWRPLLGSDAATSRPMSFSSRRSSRVRQLLAAVRRTWRRGAWMLLRGQGACGFRYLLEGLPPPAPPDASQPGLDPLRRCFHGGPPPPVNAVACSWAALDHEAHGPAWVQVSSFHVHGVVCTLIVVGQQVPAWLASCFSLEFMFLLGVHWRMGLRATMPGCTCSERRAACACPGFSTGF